LSAMDQHSFGPAERFGFRHAHRANPSDISSDLGRLAFPLVRRCGGSVGDMALQRVAPSFLVQMDLSEQGITRRWYRRGYIRLRPGRFYSKTVVAVSTCHLRDGGPALEAPRSGDGGSSGPSNDWHQ